MTLDYYENNISHINSLIYQRNEYRISYKQFGLVVLIFLEYFKKTSRQGKCIVR